ncbi:MAG: DUF397 domain-containing protein [Pseudonocardiaceae bacterium]
MPPSTPAAGTALTNYSECLRRNRTQSEARLVAELDVRLLSDSKDRDGPALAVPSTAWRAFLRTLTR